MKKTILNSTVALTAEGAIKNPPIYEQARTTITFSIDGDPRTRVFSSEIKWSVGSLPHFTFKEEGKGMFSGTLIDLKAKNEGKINTDTRENLIMMILLRATMEAMIAAQKEQVTDLIYLLRSELTDEQLNEIFTD